MQLFTLPQLKSVSVALRDRLPKGFTLRGAKARQVADLESAIFGIDPRMTAAVAASAAMFTNPAPYIARPQSLPSPQPPASISPALLLNMPYVVGLLEELLFFAYIFFA